MATPVDPSLHWAKREQGTSWAVKGPDAGVRAPGRAICKDRGSRGHPAQGEKMGGVRRGNDLGWKVEREWRVGAKEQRGWGAQSATLWKCHC